MKTIRYLIAALALSATAFCQSIDQQQTTYNAATSMPTSPANYYLGQSFTAGVTGTLTRIDIGFVNAFSGTGTVRVWSGSSPIGMTVIASVPITVTSINGAATYSSCFPNVAIQANAAYYFEFVPVSMPNPIPFAVGTNVAYNRGECAVTYQGASHWTISTPPQTTDLMFRTWVL